MDFKTASNENLFFKPSAIWFSRESDIMVNKVLVSATGCKFKIAG